MTDKELLKQLIELHEQEQAFLEQLRSIRQQMESLAKSSAVNIKLLGETICVQHGGKFYQVTFFHDLDMPVVESFQLYVLLDEVKE